MQDKRAVERYKDHEIICVTAPDADGWHYTLSILGHKGEQSAVRTEKSREVYKSETAALQAAFRRGRQLIDDMMA